MYCTNIAYTVYCNTVTYLVCIPQLNIITAFYIVYFIPFFFVSPSSSSSSNSEEEDELLSELLSSSSTTCLARLEWTNFVAPVIFLLSLVSSCDLSCDSWYFDGEEIQPLSIPIDVCVLVSHETSLFCSLGLIPFGCTWISI